MERDMAEREPLMDGPRVDEPSEAESDDEPVIEKWHGVTNAIRNTTKSAFAASPPFDPSSPSTFQTYWRTVFNRLRQDIAANPDIPRHLTSPPVTKFTVSVFDNIHGLCCPCGHPDVEPNITLKNKDGVTKEELMDGFVNYMYGEALPGVYIEPAPPLPKDYEPTSEDSEGYDDCADEVEGPALVYSAAWMSSVFREDGERVAYASEPNIVLYCCRPEEFAEKREDKDGDGEVEAKEAEGESKARL